MADEVVLEPRPASEDEQAGSGERAGVQPKPTETREPEEPTGGPVAPAEETDPQTAPQMETQYDAVQLEQPETVETEWGPAEGPAGHWKVTPREGGSPFLVHPDDLGRFFVVRPAP